MRLRDQLVHSERLSAIGELVAGVAHEINNPLQTIVGSVELMMEEHATPAMQRDLEVVRRRRPAPGRSCGTCFVCPPKRAGSRAVDLNEIVRATVRAARVPPAAEQHRSWCELHPAPLPALANREEIQQIVLNLVMNAEQAIELSGHGTGSRVRSYSSGDHQVIEVSDDGPGIGPEIRGRIFEPFFTTKEVGQGTGLGLSISHGIAASHGGSLELCHRPGRGACFRLTLPAFIEAAMPRARSTLANGGPASCVR